MKAEVGEVSVNKSHDIRGRDLLWLDVKDGIMCTRESIRLTPGQAMRLAKQLIAWAWRRKKNRRPS